MYKDYFISIEPPNYHRNTFIAPDKCCQIVFLSGVINLQFHQTSICTF